ncbi:MAG TPA: hypothetical protein VEI26_10100 [Terriglobales bacterium]|nr:hypothetical protein [Terriglobales bacterium]
MEKLNWRRLLLGGVAAGAVLIILASASSALLMAQPSLGRALHAFRPFSSGLGEAVFSVFVFVFLGVIMTWCYAALRPRFGTGPKTAAIAAFTVWLILAGQMLISVAVSEVTPSLPPGPMLPMLYLAIIIAGTEAGAFIYTE